MPTDNRPRRHHLIVIIIVILGRFAQAVQDADTAMQNVCKDAVMCVGPTDDIYLIPASQWTTEQSAVDAACTAFCAALDGGQWPDTTALGVLVGDWHDAIKSL